MNQVICGDCLDVLSDITHREHPRMIFADPPDFLKMKYDGFDDGQWKSLSEYYDWLYERLGGAFGIADVIWFSVYHTHRMEMEHRFYPWVTDTCGEPIQVEGMVPYDYRLIPWRFTFGQHRNTDCGNGYRPLMRYTRPGVKWNMDCIRVPSARLLKYKDKRANPLGRVPDDVWEYPRVCGTFHERRPWISNQHPEALIERMILMSTQPDDLVVDLFAGSGTVHRVAKRLGRRSISIEISRTYVANILKEDEDEGKS